MSKNSFLKSCHTRFSKVILSYMNGKVDFEKMGRNRPDQEIKASYFSCYLIGGCFLGMTGLMFLIGAPLSLKFLLGSSAFIFYLFGIIHEEIFHRRFENMPSVNTDKSFNTDTSFKPRTFSEQAMVSSDTSSQSQTQILSEYTDNGKTLTKPKKRIIDWIFIGVIAVIAILSNEKPELIQKVLEKFLLLITPLLPPDLQYDYQIFIPEMLNNPEYYFYIFFFIIIIVGVIGCFASLIYRAVKK